MYLSSQQERRYTETLYVMVIGCEVWTRTGAPPTLTSQGWFFHHDGMYAKNRHSVCTLWSGPPNLDFVDPELDNFTIKLRILYVQTYILL